MTKKKNSKKQNTAEKQAQQEEPKEKELNTSSEEIQEEEIATCDEDINSLETQIEELKDKHLRLFSEFDNFRKRTTKERIELFKTANADLLLDLIPVLDDFDRAMKSFEDAKDIESVRQGVEICSDVTIGMGAVVIKDIKESGVYIGNPLRKLVK